MGCHKGIQKSYLQHRFAHRKKEKLKQIAIDEISIGKGHRYFSVVFYLDTGAVVFVGDGKGAEALHPFWKISVPPGERQGRCHRYVSGLCRGGPGSFAQRKIVFDHFHIVKLFNDKLSDLRRKLYHEIKDMLTKQVIKGTRWLLLKNPENLNKDRDEPQRLQEALKLNQPLAAAYYMKEDLRQFWTQHKQKAEDFSPLDIPRKIFRHLHAQKFANTLSRRKAMLAYHDFPISTGPFEGTNNKIKTMQKQSYGFRDMDFLKLKIMALHLTKYALVG